MSSLTTALAKALFALPLTKASVTWSRPRAKYMRQAAPLGVEPPGMLRWPLRMPLAVTAPTTTTASAAQMVVPRRRGVRDRVRDGAEQTIGIKVNGAHNSMNLGRQIDLL